MSLDYTAKIADTIASLQDSMGMSAKADLATTIGGTASPSDSMATLISRLSGRQDLINNINSLVQM